jgi:predicted dehydrogenase
LIACFWNVPGSEGNDDFHATHLGYPMEAPGVGGGNAEMFTYQARSFLDQVAAVADPIPACASFADALRTMKIIQAVVESARSGGAAVAVPEGN